MYRKKDVFLVEIDNMYALVDEAARQVHVINKPAAHAWATLEQGCTDKAFMHALAERRLVTHTPADSGVDISVPRQTGTPRIVSSAPIQVAAGSGQGQFTEAEATPDPFSYDW